MSDEIDFINNVIIDRDSYGHKGTFGKILIIAGSEGMTGAAIMAAKSAQKCGAGLVFVAAPRGILPVFEITLPEFVKIPLGNRDSVCFDDSFSDFLIEKSAESDCVIIGPGLGRKEETQKFIKRFIKNEKSKSIVIDADAIYAYRDNTDELSEALTDKNAVITPHEGEYSYLSGNKLEYDANSYEKKRLYAAKELSRKINAVTVLKGKNTVICNQKGEYRINKTGNCGMAKGGSGDILSGIISAFSASKVTKSTKYDIIDAVSAAVYIHGLSGDIAEAKKGNVSMTPFDIIDSIPDAIKKVNRNE